ncbi:peptide ABC transporter substrate-binding protein [Weizmannia acidilactici]|jgi:oligopeptide transport system substrate-binding protein|uniref:peptide ABC transporter substrate-binding protein n=1 Tax=Weizmannia acidilactici TaxID=2607726 RepID=UPI00124E2059|nr:peptide ABC transporter substrate-binding protein [Weizmannia acidilactici]GER67360.1 peptide ABC transporter substrate-binding protein [Weizmannia acidilactici]GER72640.1 peptide ABC transporter substrate-binding protein [Weizmannia acidilactici]
MKKSKFYVFMTLAFVLSLVLGACGSNNSSSSGSKSGNSSTKQVLNWIASAEIPSGDPTLATDQESFILFGNTMEGLYRIGKDDNLYLADAAEEPTVSKDGKTYTFKLRKDAKWSNGDPVTAKDYVFSWQRAVNPKVGSQYSYIFAGVIKNASDILAGKKQPSELGVKAIDDYTLQVQLERPTPYLKSLLAFPTYFPQNQKFVESKGKKYGTNSDNMLFNGPFILKNWNGTGLTWKYVKNPNYYDKDKVKLQQINFQVVKAVNTGVNLYNTGKVDRVGLSNEYAQQYKNSKEAHTYPTSSVFYFKYNEVRNGKKTALANINIRKALAMAVDKQSYVDTTLGNGSIPANGLVPKDFVKDPKTGQDFRAENGDFLKYNASEAKKYWEKGLKELGVKSLTFELLGDDTDDAKKSSEFIQNQLEKNLPGLTLKLKNVPFKNRLQLDTNQDYDIQLAGWGPDYQDPMTFLDLFVTNGDNNKSGYSNKQYDKLINEAKTTYANNPEKRWQVMLKAEKILMNDAAIGPLYQRAYLRLQKPYVKGVEDHLFGPDTTFRDAYVQK